MKLYPLNFITLPNGETLAYRKAGNKGPHLILIHGNMSSSVHFTQTMDRLKERFQLYAPDLRGFGKSSYQRPSRSLRDLGQDVQLFMEAIAIPHAILLGWSMGGGVALEIAADIPQQIDQVFLVGSVGLQGYASVPTYPIPQYAVLPRLFMNQTRRGLVKWDPFLQKVESAIKTRDRKFLSKLLNTLYYRHKPAPNEFDLYLEAMYEQRNFSAIVNDLLEFNMTHHPNAFAPGSNRYPHITAPIVIIHGLKDIVVDAIQAQKMKAYFGNQAHLYLLDTGHAVMSNNFPEFIAILEKELPHPINSQ